MSDKYEIFVSEEHMHLKFPSYDTIKGVTDQPGDTELFFVSKEAIERLVNKVHERALKMGKNQLRKVIKESLQHEH